MSPHDIIIVGAGGFGREAADVIRAINIGEPEHPWEIVGTVDDNPSSDNLARLQRRGLPFLGSIHEGLRSAKGTLNVVVAIGSPRQRVELVRRIMGIEQYNFPRLIHPSAEIGSVAELGAGVVICGGVQLSTNVRIGHQVHLNPNCTIGHDATLHDFVSVNPGAIVSGECVIKSHALLGAGSVVLQGLTIGENAIVGASACVVRDVPDGAVVKGVPARVAD